MALKDLIVKNPTPRKQTAREVIEECLKNYGVHGRKGIAKSIAARLRKSGHLPKRSAHP